MKTYGRVADASGRWEHPPRGAALPPPTASPGQGPEGPARMQPVLGDVAARRRASSRSRCFSAVQSKSNLRLGSCRPRRVPADLPRPVPSRPAVPWPPPGGAAWCLPTSPGLGIASDGPDSKAMAPMLISSLYRLFSSARKCVGPRNGDGSALSSLGRSTPGRSFL